ncbi:MAG: MFS transporter [Actinomycetaceae bacterium]|nr:MFS transporter [Actinomycetaceae bacterium]
MHAVGLKGLIHGIISHPLRIRTTLASMATGAFISSTGSIIVILARDFSRPETDFSLVGSAFGCGCLIVGLVGRFALQHVGASRMLDAMALLFSLGVVWLIFAPTFTMAIAAALLAGFAASAALLLMPYVFQGPGAASMMAFTTGCSSLAGVLAPFIYGFVDSFNGLNGRYALLINFVLILPILLIGRPRTHANTTIYVEGDVVAPSEHTAGKWHNHESTGICEDSTTCPASDAEVSQGSAPDTALSGAVVSASGTDGAASDIAKLSSPKQPFFSIPPRVTALLLSCYLRQFLAMCIEYLIYAWGATKLVSDGMSVGAASMGVAAFPLGMMSTRLFAAPFAQRRAIMQICAALVVAGLSVIVVSPSVVVTIFGFYCAGCGVGLMYPIALDAILRVPGVAAQKATATATLIGGIAILAGPMGAAYVGEAFGLDAAFSVGIICALILAVLPSQMHQLRGGAHSTTCR